MRTISLSGLILVAILMLSAIELQAQNKEGKQKKQDEIDAYVVNNDTYEQVLDLVFPRDALWGAGGYGLVFRYEPTFDAESQISIINRGDKIEVVEYTPVEGSIYQQLKKILKRVGDFNAKEAARHIKIRRRVVNVSPALVKQLHDSFYDRLNQLASHEKRITTKKTGSINVVDDGTRYLLFYRGQSIVQFDLIGTNLDSPLLSDESPIIEWMKQVHRTIRSLPTLKIT